MKKNLNETHNIMAYIKHLEMIIQRQRTFHKSVGWIIQPNALRAKRPTRYVAQGYFSGQPLQW